MIRAQWFGWPRKKSLYGQGEGPGGECVCPKCGTKSPHVAGTPCTKISCPKCGAKMVRDGVIINKAYNRSRCMQCKKPPRIDVQWADGRGRAWFCVDHFLEWATKEHREIVRAWFIKDGPVPVKVKDHPGVRLRTSGQKETGPKKIADQARELAHG